MHSFSNNGRRFVITTTETGWAWSVATMAGRTEAGGVCATKAQAAACIVRATLLGVVGEAGVARHPSVERAA